MVLEKDDNWAENKRNEDEDALREMDTSRNLMATKHKKITSLFKHILTHNDFAKNILERKIIWKKRRGPRMTIFGEILNTLE